MSSLTILPVLLLKKQFSLFQLCVAFVMTVDSVLFLGLSGEFPT